jgi:hypothetical protein
MMSRFMLWVLLASVGCRQVEQLGFDAGFAGTSWSDASAGGDPLDADTSADTDTWGAPTAPTEPGVTPASDMEISGLDIYQALRVPVTGESNDLPIIAGRAALARVSLVRGASWVPRPVTVRLRVMSDDGAAWERERTLTPTGDSRDNDLESTVNFELPEDRIAPGLAVRATVFEALEEAPAGDASRSVFPPKIEWATLDVVDPGGPLEIAIIPIRYEADGSGRLPDTSPAALDDYRQAFETIYPVARVDLRVLDPVPWYEEVAADGTGWEDLLVELIDQRALSDNPREYYFGLFEPADSFAEYCAEGCVAGLSPLVTEDVIHESLLRAGIGLAFPSSSPELTMVHEVGHAHGREHSPCGLYGQPSDPGYPHDDATLGRWGYDQADRRLYNPEVHRDFMSYCQPMWTSDYTFAGILERVRAVNALEFGAPGGGGFWRMIAVRSDGTLRIGSPVELDRPPGGVLTSVELLGVNGRVLATTRGRFVPFDHLDGGLLPVPEPPVLVRGLRLPKKPPVFF